jgi:thioredoxin 1
MGAVTEATDQSFEQEVLKAELPVLVDFWGPGCAPCARMAPILERIAADMAGRMKFVKVNVADQYETAARYGISMVPTLLLFKGGSVTDTLVGLRSEADLRQLLTAAQGS